MPDDGEWTSFKALGKMSFTFDPETGETKMGESTWAIIPDGPLLESHFVKGLGLVVQSTELDGRIEYEGKVFRIEEIESLDEDNDFIEITKDNEDGTTETQKFIFQHKVRIFIEDVEARTVDKMVGYITEAVRSGTNYTIQNWTDVVSETAPRWERPRTAGSRFDREVL